jgi:hypothetical protein
MRGTGPREAEPWRCRAVSRTRGRLRERFTAPRSGTGTALRWKTHFFKYVDGIEELRWWHQGRCLSYGEGVGYWALAEMIRSRAGIAEDESPESAREKLREAVSEAVSEHVHDERERRLIEPRLAHLLRLDDRAEPDRGDLFSGWRLFFERMAADRPLILVFEDLHADSGVLDFIDYLMEWSAEYPIFIFALSRPGLRERARTGGSAASSTACSK